MMRLMCVTAHPDDEAASFGGSLLLYREREVETFVLCMTSGQAATHRGGVQSDHELGVLRKKEFAAACRILRVSRAMVLDYPDGQLHRHDLCKAVSDVTRYIREFRPHILLTMGPEGAVTGHTDHSMVSVFATLAFHWAGRENRFPDQLAKDVTPHVTQKLYYSTADFALAGRPPVTLSPITTSIEVGRFVDTKIAAFKAHTTQLPLANQWEEMVRRRGGKELFHLAASAKYGPIVLESDLFENLEEGG